MPAAAGLILAVGRWLSAGRSDVRLSRHISRLLCWMQLESNDDPLAAFQEPTPNPVGPLHAFICSFTWSPIEVLFILPREAMRFIHAPISSASVPPTDSHTHVSCGSCGAVHSPSDPSYFLFWYMDIWTRPSSKAIDVFKIFKRFNIFIRLNFDCGRLYSIMSAKKNLIRQKSLSYRMSTTLLSWIQWSLIIVDGSTQRRTCWRFMRNW